MIKHVPEFTDNVAGPGETAEPLRSTCSDLPEYTPRATGSLPLCACAYPAATCASSPRSEAAGLCSFQRLTHDATDACCPFVEAGVEAVDVFAAAVVLRDAVALPDAPPHAAIETPTKSASGMPAHRARLRAIEI
jgi:hypothetical protein